MSAAWEDAADVAQSLKKWAAEEPASQAGDVHEGSAALYRYPTASPGDAFCASAGSTSHLLPPASGAVFFFLPCISFCRVPLQCNAATARSVTAKITTTATTHLRFHVPGNMTCLPFRDAHFG